MRAAYETRMQPRPRPLLDPEVGRARESHVSPGSVRSRPVLDLLRPGRRGLAMHAWAAATPSWDRVPCTPGTPCRTVPGFFSTRPRWRAIHDLAMTADPAVASPGSLVTLWFSGEMLHGVAFSLEAQRASGWEVEYYMVAGRDGKAVKERLPFMSRWAISARRAMTYGRRGSWSLAGSGGAAVGPCCRAAVR